METNSEMKAKIMREKERKREREKERKRERGSQEYSVTADERQTCRQSQSQILLFKALHSQLLPHALPFHPYSI
ncbi:hypothetical protein VNO77_39607 [Canavalia gladiata]|uniref:Uncharacterized protein n=1 Tax=Canavalia gladiata TaxID=3824 RepID=A0AAN9JXJ8_CANGL